MRHRPVTPDFRSQQLPHGVLAVLSKDARVFVAQSRPGFWENGVPVLGYHLFGLPPEGDTHRQPWDEVVETVATRGWAPVCRQQPLALLS